MTNSKTACPRRGNEHTSPEAMEYLRRNPESRLLCEHCYVNNHRRNHKPPKQPAPGDPNHHALPETHP